MTQEEKYIKEHNFDEIDAFLFKEFGLLGGACSTLMSLKYNTARKVAEKLWEKEGPVSEDLEKELSSWWNKHYWNIKKNYTFEGYNGQYIENNTLIEIANHFAQWQKQQMIDKACKWLNENKDHPFIGCEDPCLSGYLTEGFIEEFCKAMEE